MYLVVGLGNTDNKYLKTMHNMGFMAIDLIAQNLGVEFNKKALKGTFVQTQIGGEKVILLKPLTYMNLSGDCVQEFLNYYKISPQKLIVIYDDIDIGIGSVRIRKKGSAGTHNGMRDIVNKINSQDFMRIRIGIKPTEFKGDLIDYVLSNMNKEDEITFKNVFNNVCEAVKMLVSNKPIDEVMNKFSK